MLLLRIKEKFLLVTQKSVAHNFALVKEKH